MSLFLDRICGSWDVLPKAQRKPLSFKDALPLHSATALFLHFMDMVERRAPASEFQKHKGKFFEAFRLGGLDGELQRLAETTVPPGDPLGVQMFRLEGCGGLMEYLI